MARDQIGFLVDLDRCTGCNACQIACMDRHDVQEGAGRLVIRDFEGLLSGKPYVYHLPFTCFHCAEPPCVPACPESAIVKREADGVVLIDERCCTGCLICLDACPFGALSPDLSRGVVTKCDYCVEDIGAGGPACASACPFEALVAGPLSGSVGRQDVVTTVRGFPAAGSVGPAIVFVPIAPAQSR